MNPLFRAVLTLAAGALCAHAADGPAYACRANDTLRSYSVHLKGGEVLRGNSAPPCRVQDAAAMRLQVQGRTVYPFQTDSVFEEGVRGLPAPGGAAWAFPVLDGRIRGFAPRRGLGLKDANALSKDSEPLVRYSLKALEDRMRDDPGAADLIRSKRNAGITAGAMAFGGAAVTFIGVITSMEPVKDDGNPFTEDEDKMEFRPNPLFFAGIGMMLGSWFVPGLLTENNPEKAVRRYNAAFADSAAKAAEP